jgi:hypothetical protein
MHDITATELQMLECFGVEPQVLDPNEPWCYNDALYLVELDGLSISFAVQPAYQDVRLIVHRGEQRLYELNAVGVRDVLVLDEPERDIVEVRLSEQEWLRLQLRPSFEITQGFERLDR